MESIIPLGERDALLFLDLAPNAVRRGNIIVSLVVDTPAFQAG